MENNFHYSIFKSKFWLKNIMHNFMFKQISSKEEMEKSYAIRTKVFCEEQKISKEIEFDNLDHLCSHFLIFNDKKVIATARVRQKEDNILKIERVAVLFEFRRLKVGSTLINNIIQYFTNLNDNLSFVLHSQVAVANFYESINFISYGDKFFEDGIPHIAMKYIKV